MHKRIILVGKAASGKDHLRKTLESRNFKYAISYTTRPPREGEVDGRDYFFINSVKAYEMIQSGEFFEYVMFNGWLYGTSVEQWQQKDDESVYIMTPTGLSHVNEEDRKECLVIYTDIDIETDMVQQEWAIISSALSICTRHSHHLRTLSASIEQVGLQESVQQIWEVIEVLQSMGRWMGY